MSLCKADNLLDYIITVLEEQDNKKQLFSSKTYFPNTLLALTHYQK